MRGGSGILARNNFAGRANPSRIFAGQARGGPMRGRLTCFAIPISRRVKEKFWRRCGGKVMKMKKAWRQSDGNKGEKNIHSKGGRWSDRTPPPLMLVPHVCSTLSKVRCLFTRRFDNRAPTTPWENVMSVASTEEPFCPVKLGSSLRGLCTGRTCLDPQPKHLNVVSSIR